MHRLVIASAYQLWPCTRKWCLDVGQLGLGYLLVTCYLLNSQLKSKAVNADIGPKVVQPVFERIDRWSINNPEGADSIHQPISDLRGIFDC